MFQPSSLAVMINVTLCATFNLVEDQIIFENKLCFAFLPFKIFTKIIIDSSIFKIIKFILII
jgi:hypothetical protein